MKILIVTDAWRPQVNGVVRTIAATAAELERRGHHVQVIGPDAFRTIPLPSYSEIRLAVLPGRKLARMMALATPDMIHIATEGPLGWAARRWCLNHDKAFTTAYHTRFPEYLSRRVAVPLWFSYAVLCHFHAPACAVMVATQTLMDELAGQGFCNLRLWTRGVDTEQFTFKLSSSAKAEDPADASAQDSPPARRTTIEKRELVLLSVGRIAVEKNLRAFLDLDLDIPGRKIVVGDGPELAELRRDYPNVEFTGALEGEALAAAYSAADVFVFPSRTDTFGLVLVEALACGTPVAAYPVPGPADVLAPQNKAAPVGVLHDDLKHAIEGCLELKIPPERCRAFAREHYGWAAATDQFLDSCSAICNDGSRT